MSDLFALSHTTAQDLKEQIGTGQMKRRQAYVEIVHPSVATLISVRFPLENRTSAHLKGCDSTNCPLTKDVINGSGFVGNFKGFLLFSVLEEEKCDKAMDFYLFCSFWTHKYCVPWAFCK